MKRWRDEELNWDKTKELSVAGDAGEARTRRGGGVCVFSDVFTNDTLYARHLASLWSSYHID